jgi:hypothetical protein
MNQLKAQGMLSPLTVPDCNLPNVSLAATHKLKAKGTRAEEESVPRQDGAGRACHGWRVLRLSDLTVFPEQARSHNHPYQVSQA